MSELLTLPTDPVEIQAQLADLLAQTPETTDRGRIMHLLNALIANGSGGGGLPLSEATTGGLRIWAQPQNSYVGNQDFIMLGEPYSKFIPAYNTLSAYNQHQSTTPYATQGIRGRGIDVGNAMATIDGSDLVVEVNAVSQLGDNIYEKYVGTLATGHTFVQVINMINPEYSITSVHAISARKVSTTQIELQLYRCQEGQAQTVGAVTTLDIAIGANDVDALRLAFTDVGNGDYFACVAHIDHSSSLARVLFSMEKLVGATTVYFTDTLLKNQPEITIAPIYSYNGSTHGFATNSENPSNRIYYEIYTFDASTGVMAYLSDTVGADLSTQGAVTYFPQIIWGKSFLSADVAFLMSSLPFKDVASIDYTEIDLDAGTVVDHTLDLTEFDSEYWASQPCMVQFGDGGADARGFLIGLQHRTEPRMDFYTPLGKKLIGTYPTWNAGRADSLYDQYLPVPMCYGLDDYMVFMTRQSGHRGYGNKNHTILGTDPWGWYTFSNPNTVTYPPEDRLMDTYENQMGAIVAQENPVATVNQRDRNGNFETFAILPAVNTVLHIHQNMQLVIPDGAPVGTQWTLVYSLRTVAEYPFVHLGNTMQGVVALGDTDNTEFIVVWTPLIGKSFEAPITAAVHITKTADDTYTAQNLV